MLTDWRNGTLLTRSRPYHVTTHIFGDFKRKGHQSVNKLYLLYNNIFF